MMGNYLKFVLSVLFLAVSNQAFSESQSDNRAINWVMLSYMPSGTIKTETSYGSVASSENYDTSGLSLKVGKYIKNVGSDKKWDSSLYFIYSALNPKAKVAEESIDASYWGVGYDVYYHASKVIEPYAGLSVGFSKFDYSYVKHYLYSPDINLNLSDNALAYAGDIGVKFNLKDDVAIHVEWSYIAANNSDTQSGWTAKVTGISGFDLGFSKSF